MELIIVAGSAISMALISIISILLQKYIFENNQTKWQWHKRAIPAREEVQLDLKTSEDITKLYKDKLANR